MPSCMKHETILIGIKHRTANLENVITFLEKMNISRKKVMIETPRYPIPERYYERNRSYCDFYDGLYQYLYKKGAHIIHGDSEELIEKAHKKLFGLWSYSLFSDDWWREYKKTICEERDPYFYMVYKIHHPKIIVIDGFHTLYLRKRIQCEYYEIPKES